MLGNGAASGYLKNPGDLEKEILRKGMSKKEAQAAKAKYMNDQQLMQARQADQKKAAARRLAVERDDALGNYGGENKGGFEMGDNAYFGGGDDYEQMD